jgi:hypothetical protein
MSKLIGILLAVVFVTIGADYAAGDTISNGTLSFSCLSCTLPTSGSFTYDNTTNEFTNFQVVWDGMTFDLSQATQTNFLAMTGVIPSALTWTAACEPSNTFPTVPCDGLLHFSIFAGTNVLGEVTRPLSPTLDTVSAAGEFSVTRVTVPEPGPISLALTAVVVMIAMRRSIVQLRN